MAVTSIWFLCLVVTPFVPYAPVLGIIAFGLNYWIEKYYFLRGCVVSERNNTLMFFYSLNILRFSCYPFLLIIICFEAYWKGSVSSSTKINGTIFYLVSINISSLILYIFLTLIPIQRIFKYFFNSKEGNHERPLSETDL